MEIVRYLFNNTLFIGVLGFLLIMVPIFGIAIIHPDNKEV